MATLSIRKSLPLTPSDVAGLDLIRRSPTHRRMLERITGAEVSSAASEASLLHAVLTAGLQSLNEKAEAEGYAQIAADRQASREARQRAARRRRPAWADE